MYRIAVIDDNQEILDYVEMLLKEEYKDNVLITKIKSKEEYDYLAEYEKTTNYDIVLMDIVLDDASGVDFANEYARTHNRTKFIFITGYTEYAPDIFKATPVGLIVKPITKERLYEAVDRAMDLYSNDASEYMKIATKEQIYNIAIKDILYVESEGHHLFINTLSGIINVTMKLNDFEHHIEETGMAKNFIRCHQSFIVNSDYISSLGYKTIQMQNGIEIPVSRNKKNSAKEQYLEYLVTKV